MYRAMVNSAAILQGVSTRLIIIWRACGYTSLRDWFDGAPSSVMRVFRGASSACANIQRRQRMPAKRLSIFGIYDPALRDQNDRVRNLVMAFVGGTRAEHGDGLAGKYWTHMINAQYPLTKYMIIIRYIFFIYIHISYIYKKYMHYINK